MHAVAASAKASETLSQFVARILDQLTLSAWLPAGALVVLTTVIVELGSIVHGQTPIPSVVDALRQTGRSIGEISLGGALLLLVAVVVTTMVTQAFAFEAIRVLEGYWGTSRAVEWVADRRCNHFRRKLECLTRKIESINESAWPYLQTALADQRKAAMVNGDSAAEISEELSFILEAQFKGQVPPRGPTSEETEVLNRFFESGEWELYVPANSLRRLNNLTKRQRDYPVEPNVLPTRLGNVLRHYEDETEIRKIESYVEENFDRLPASLQITHDQRRSRLDLYCAMVFVSAVITSLAVVVLWRDLYPLAAAVLGLAAVSLSYRAAVASGRSYGTILATLVKWLHHNEARTPAKPTSSRYADHTERDEATSGP